MLIYLLCRDESRYSIVNYLSLLFYFYIVNFSTSQQFYNLQTAIFKHCLCIPVRNQTGELDIRQQTELKQPYFYVTFRWHHQSSLLPSSSNMRSLPLLSMPEVCELPWLVVDELQVRRGLCGIWPKVRKLSASMPEVCELPWLVVEWRDRRLWWETLPALLPLARECLSRCSMSSSRASLMYDSLYCFFSESIAF